MERTHHLISCGKRHNMNHGGKKRRSIPKHRRIVYTGVDSPTLDSDPGYDTVAGNSQRPIIVTGSRTAFTLSDGRPTISFVNEAKDHYINAVSTTARCIGQSGFSIPGVPNNRACTTACLPPGVADRSTLPPSGQTILATGPTNNRPPPFYPEFCDSPFNFTPSYANKRAYGNANERSYAIKKR